MEAYFNRVSVVQRIFDRVLLSVSFRSLRSPLISFALLAATPLAVNGAVQLPVRVFSWNAEPSTERVSVDVPEDANPADRLYAQVHNLRFGGQVSIRVNSGDWVDIQNHTVTVMEPEKSQGGIGGINATIRIQIPLEPGSVITGQSNTVSFRLNGTNGVVSGIRVVDFNFLDSDDIGILLPETFSQEDPSSWTSPSEDPVDIAAGAALWSNAPLIDDPVHNRPIYGKCASCHFVDGSDLKYFNFSSDSIVTRSRFHGLSQAEGKQVASYIRSIEKPNPGRPWNPPFQPGPDLDPGSDDEEAIKLEKARSWMAGAGLDWVLEDESEILPHIFPEGTSPSSIGRVFEHEGTFSVREIPIPIQFPDWNAWLPEFALEDMWDSASYYDEPYALYNTLRSALEDQGAEQLGNSGLLNETFRRFKSNLEDWYGTFRLPDENLSNDSLVSLARVEELSREDVIKSLMRWMVVKMTEVTRDFDLEGKTDSISAMQNRGHPNFTPELLAMPGGENRAIVFGLAPHISGNVYLHFEDQPEHLGKMESNQWYHLQLCINSGYRMQVNMNVPLDWAYQVIHLESASERAGRKYGIQRLITQIKMLQIRETGKGIMQGGFSQRTLNPCYFYSTPHRDRSLMKGALDSIEEGLWKKVFEEYLYEWLDVIQTHNLNTMPRDDGDRHQFETATYVPVPWPGGNDKYFDRPGEIHADALYRLLPLLPVEDIDEMLLEDVRTWCQRAWPYEAPRWGSTPSWDSLFSLQNIYSENFEDNASDFEAEGAVLSVTAIKDGDYVNNDAIGPQNGGGAYVAQKDLEVDANWEGVYNSIDAPLNGVTRLKLRARVAFEDYDSSDPGQVRFKMRMRFDESATTYETEDTLTLDPKIYGDAFESYTSHLDVPAGATKIAWLSIAWERVGGTGAGISYVDNIHILPVDKTLDTTAPSAPVLTNITKPADLQLRANWSETNPESEGVIGYNVYRWIEGEPETSKIKMNTGIVDNPYIRFEDYTPQREIEYNYHITAVDAAGNESAPSNSASRTLPNTDLPLAPSTIWVANKAKSLRLSWFGATDWDIAGYLIYRKADGESEYSVLASINDPSEAIFYDDESTSVGINYEYYVESLDSGGNRSTPSSKISILAESLGIDFDTWSSGYDGINGWISSDSAIAGDNIDYDQDGSPTLWEYIQGSNPTVAENPSSNFPTARVVAVNGYSYLEASYLRQETLPPGVYIKALLSNDLQDWSTAFTIEGDEPSIGVEIGIGDADNGTRRIAVRHEVALENLGSYRFIRFVAVQE